MRKIELVADGTVVSYMFRRRALGNAYTQLIGDCPTGIALLAVSESRQGVVYGNWGDPRTAALDAFLSRFFILEANAEIAEVPGLRVLTLHADWQIREENVGASPSSPLWLGERSVASKWSYECAPR